ncbi:MAG: acetylornithine/succinylornithine family transaminase [Chitinispirillaceae bacterium]|nr:acetylornithine/succinylornithine family transaminase [Chitinispirillaceae bacterium]
MKNQDYNDLFVPTYARSGAPLVKGRGMYLYDTNGKPFLDFGAGIAVNALGHAHPALVKAVTKNGALLLHTSNLYFNKTNLDFAALLANHVFPGKLFLCNTGTEANEAAMKFSRKWATATDRSKYHILSFSHGFHGRTYGAMSATAQPVFHKGFKPLLPGCHYAPFNDLAATGKLLDKYSYAAVIVEPFQGEGGITRATTEFLKFLRKYCTGHRIALLFDEIQCGMGRTGTLWHYQQHGVVPDMMTLAKPVGGGLPLGAVVVRNDIAACIKPGDHGTTFGGNPLACALGIETLKIVTRPSFLASVRKNGAYLMHKLEALAKKYPLIREVRGCGLLVGVEVTVDPKEIVAACRELGLLVIKAERHTVRFIPPLIVTKKEIDKAVGIFEKAIAVCKQ